jgi:UDP-N-acetylglucosamine acyltransferase
VQDRSETVIGNNNLLMAYAHIGHDCVVGNNCIFVNNASISGHVYVGDWSILSGYALVHQFCHIGPHAFVGPATVILKDIPAYVMAAGNPVKANNINVEGLKRRGFSSAAIAELRRAFKIIYRQGLTVDEALAELQPMVAATPEVQPLIDSIAKSSRGILR